MQIVFAILNEIQLNSTGLTKVLLVLCSKYNCTKCEYQCKSKSTLRMHIESKHEGKTYGCNQCDYEATNQINLRFHMQSKHLGTIILYAFMSRHNMLTQTTWICEFFRIT